MKLLFIYFYIFIFYNYNGDGYEKKRYNRKTYIK